MVAAVPRYMDACEAAWLLGFTSDLVLPQSSQVAMHCLGNCVAPVQAAQIWNFLGFEVSAPPFAHLLRAVMLGRAPLNRFERFACDRY